MRDAVTSGVGGRPVRVGGGTVGTAAAVLAALVLAACGEAGDGAATVRDSAGVRIVENEAGSRALEAEVVHLADLMPPDSTLGVLPWGVAASPTKGRLYVGDRRGQRVVMFDRGGEYVGSFGSPGGGPGEFERLSALTLGPERSVVIWDTGRGILSEWSLDGELIDERRPGIGYWGPGFALAPEQLFTVTSVPNNEPGGGREQRLVVKRSEDRSVLHTVSQRMKSMELCFSMPAPEIYSPDVVWTARADTVYVRHGPGYRIDVHADGEPVESIRRAAGPIEVDREMARRRVQFGPGPYRGFMRRCGVGPDEVVEEVGYREVASPVMALSTDPTGRLWVTRSNEAIRPDSLDLFRADGAYRGTVAAPGVPVAFVAEDRFAAIRLDRETGRAVLGLYEVRGLGGEGSTDVSGGASPERTAGDRPEEAATDASAAGSDAPGAPDRPEWAPPVREDLQTFRDCEGCPVMVELSAGDYTMGAPEGEAPADEIPNRPEATERAERPQVEVTIEEPFAIGKYEVTFAQWDRCVEAGGCEHDPDDEGWGRGDRPVIHVSRTDAKQYAAWLSERTGESYRLPSEAEWEYAARAGTETARWWGDELGEGRVPCDGCGTSWDGKSTAPVGSFPANPWGLHDMLSNVEEWTADCWHPSHAGHPGDGSARVESSEWWRAEGWEERRGLECRRPVTRGGAFGHFPWTVRAAHRYYYWPHPNWTEREGDARGFRLVREVSSGDGG